MKNLVKELSPNFRRYAIGIQYYGPSFSGWSTCKHDMETNSLSPSIPNKLSGAFTSFVGTNNFQNLRTSSRTDAGVHALRNVFQVDLQRRDKEGALVDGGYSTDTIRRALNNHLNNPHIVITDVEEKDASYDARGFTTGRTYTYRIVITTDKSENRAHFTINAMFHSEMAWLMTLTDSSHLDIDAMKAAAEFLVGERDFGCFRAADCESLSTRRCVTVLDIKTHPLDDHDSSLRDVWLLNSSHQVITITISANAFLKKMIRNIVAVLVAIGKRKISLEAFKHQVVRQEKFNIAPAPPQGLYLVDVHYQPGEITSLQRAQLNNSKSRIECAVEDE